MKVVLQDDKRSRLEESANLFGVPLTHESATLENSLVPVMPRNLRHLVLPSDAFESGLFDPALKQEMLASVLTFMKSDKSLRETSRWSSTPNCNPESSKYAGPPGIRLK